MQTPTISEENPLKTGEDAVSQYILSTLMFIPKEMFQGKDKGTQAAEIYLYQPKRSTHTVKIFRSFFECRPTEESGEKLVEFAFLDEMDLLPIAEDTSPMRVEMSFSIFLDKDTRTFHSIKDRPKELSQRRIKTLGLFAKLSKKVGSKIFTRNWTFISDGTAWILQGEKGATVPHSEIDSLIPWTMQ